MKIYLVKFQIFCLFLHAFNLILCNLVLGLLNLLSHQVKCRAGLEPVNLSLVERVVQLDLEGASVSFLDLGGEWLSGSEVLQSQNGNAVLGADSVVVLLVGEGEREDSLLLQVSLVYSSERFDNDSDTSEESRLESGVFTRGTFSEISIADDYPGDFVISVIASGIGYGSPFLGDLILDLVGLSVGSVHGSNIAVVGDVGQVSSVL